MIKYVFRRIFLLIPVLIGVTVLIFTLLYFTPGDPAITILGDTATEEELHECREELGLNDPYIVRLGRYMWDVCHGDFGTSYVNGRSVSADLLSRFPTTLLLAILSTIIAVIVAIPLGIVSATHQNKWIDTVARLVSLIFVSMPNFWSGFLLIIIFAVNLKWLPATGFSGPRYWILPMVCLGMSVSGEILRNTRSSMLEVIRQDYIRTARAKGAAEHSVIWKHALPNAMIPVVTVIGNRIGMSLGGSILIESIFSVPGLGKFLVDAIKSRDYPIVQGGVLLIALAYSVVNLIVDIVYAYIDPRIKSQYKSAPKKRKKGGGQNA